MYISKERVFAFGVAVYLAHSYFRRPEEEKVDQVAQETFTPVDYSKLKRTISLRGRVKPPMGNPPNTSPVTETQDLPTTVVSKEVVGPEFVRLYQITKMQEGTEWVDNLISSLEFEDKTKVTVQQLVKAIKEVVANPDHFRFVTRQAVKEALIVFGKDHFKETLPEYFYSQILEDFQIPYPIEGEPLLNDFIRSFDFEDTTDLTAGQLVEAIKRNPDKFSEEARKFFGERNLETILNQYLETKLGVLRYIPHPVVKDCILSKRMQALYDNLSKTDCRSVEEAILIHCLEPELNKKAHLMVTDYFANV